MPLRLQAKLLHVLQDGEFSRVGGQKIIDTAVRLIAATNRDLEASMRAHQFMEDLYYRLNVIEVRIPPLRERREEIPGLVDFFLKKFNVQYGRAVDIPPDTMRVFVDYHWPGNIRELENGVKRVVVLGTARPVHTEILGNISRGPRVSVPGAPAAAVASPDAPISLKEIARQAAREAERVAIKEVLDRVHWNRAKAARLLQISYKALLYKIVQCGLVVQDTEPEKQREVIASWAGRAAREGRAPTSERGRAGRAGSSVGLLKADGSSNSRAPLGRRGPVRGSRRRAPRGPAVARKFFSVFGHPGRPASRVLP